jgi:hypothetical protein
MVPSFPGLTGIFRITVRSGSGQAVKPFIFLKASTGEKRRLARRNTLALKKSPGHSFSPPSFFPAQGSFENDGSQDRGGFFKGDFRSKIGNSQGLYLPAKRRLAR